MTTNSSADTSAETALIAQRVLRDGEYVVNHSVVAEGGIPVAVRLDLWRIARRVAELHHATSGGRLGTAPRDRRASRQRELRVSLSSQSTGLYP